MWHLFRNTVLCFIKYLLCWKLTNAEAILAYLFFFFYVFLGCFFEQKCNFCLKLFKVAEGVKKKIIIKNEAVNILTDQWMNTPSCLCSSDSSASFVNAPLGLSSSIYWDRVCNAGSQTRCCTTLCTARRFYCVISCAVCNKDKVSANPLGD